MANYTSKRKYTKKDTTKKTAVKKPSPVKTKKVVEPVKELTLIEKAVSWVKNIVK